MQGACCANLIEKLIQEGNKVVSGHYLLSWAVNLNEDCSGKSVSQTRITTGCLDDDSWELWYETRDHVDDHMRFAPNAYKVGECRYELDANSPFFLTNPIDEASLKDAESRPEKHGNIFIRGLHAGVHTALVWESRYTFCDWSFKLLG